MARKPIQSTYIVCPNCKNSFLIAPSRAKRGGAEYCSRACKHERQPERLEEHFWALWAKMDKPEDPDACWLWPGSLMVQGYGRLKVGGESHKAYRLALTLHGVILSEDQQGCHKCNNPPCVRVHKLHVYAGTVQQNIDDRQHSGHTSHGEHHWKSKLTEQDVLEIRATWGATPRKYGLLAVLSQEYHVHSSMIRAIVIGQNWTHLSLVPSQEHTRLDLIQRSLEIAHMSTTLRSRDGE